MQASKLNTKQLIAHYASYYNFLINKNLSRKAALFMLRNALHKNQLRVAARTQPSNALSRFNYAQLLRNAFNLTQLIY